MEIKKKRKNMYDPLYVSERDGISIEEAEVKIKKFKEDKVTSLIGFIKRHGEEEGRIKFEKFQETSKHTLKKYIQKYGLELGTLKFKEYTSKKDSTSFEWAMSKSNGDKDLAEKIYKERIDSLSIKFDLDYFEKKYGDLALEKMQEFKKKKDSSSYEWALSKTGGDFDLADQFYKKRCEEKCVALGKASKESLKIFNPLIDWLLNNGILLSDIYCGIKGSKELCIYDKENKKRYYYDFCVKSIGIIIEYNGEKFHPNYQKYDIDFLTENWKCPYDKNLNVLDIIKKDKTKIDFALRNGYDIHIFWSSDKDILEKIIKIIKNKLKK